jgi:hypothetical protein
MRHKFIVEMDATCEIDAPFVKAWLNKGLETANAGTVGGIAYAYKCDETNGLHGPEVIEHALEQGSLVDALIYVCTWEADQALNQNKETAFRPLICGVLSKWPVKGYMIDRFSVQHPDDMGLGGRAQASIEEVQVAVALRSGKVEQISKTLEPRHHGEPSEGQIEELEREVRMLRWVMSAALELIVRDLPVDSIRELVSKIEEAQYV